MEDLFFKRRTVVLTSERNETTYIAVFLIISNFRLLLFVLLLLVVFFWGGIVFVFVFNCCLCSRRKIREHPATPGALSSLRSDINIELSGFLRQWETADAEIKLSSAENLLIFEAICLPSLMGFCPIDCSR